MIEKVEFELHETFRNPYRERVRPPFEISTNGWGTFEIPIKIVWKKKLNLPPTYLEHMLSFSGSGKSKEYVIRINSDDIFQEKKVKKVKKAKKLTNNFRNCLLE